MCAAEFATLQGPDRGEGEGEGEGEGGAAAYGTIVVVGGGCYGAYYVRQLQRGARAGAIGWTRLVVVDRDPDCRVAREWGGRGTAGGAGAPPINHDGLTTPALHHPSPAPVIVLAEWSAFFADFLAAAAASPAAADRDAIVPSPLMPHLMYDWLLRRARERWPGRPVATVPLPSAPPTPWQRASPDGTHYVSFAEWTCPVNCVEPARCPHTRGPRDWTMPAALRAYAAAARARGQAMAGPYVMHCTHRAFGVGMFGVPEVLAADTGVRDAGTAGDARVLIGTVSHCHGALNLLAIGDTPAMPRN